MSESKNGSDSVGSALIWKLLERFGVQGIQFILQIVLARILDPNHYGMLSMMIVFTNLANIFIQNGFNTALVQNKDVTEEDYSTVFCVSTLITVVLYGVIYFAAPYIGLFYEMPEIVTPLRVLALMLFPGAINSVQLAKAGRNMDFRLIFNGNIIAIVISGMVSIFVAYFGGGLWALVVQYFLNVTIATVVMLYTVKWRPRLKINWRRAYVLFSFGWKLLVSSLIDTLYQDIRSMVVGKKYNSSTLGYYNRGKQFPQFIINAVNGAVQSVMLPVMSSEQDDKSKVRDITKASITLSAYLVFPVMAGLAGVASPLICLLLTEKWLPCVPYLQIYCFSMAFYPVHGCNLQALNAMGRSDIFLKLELIKSGIGLSALAIAVFCFDSPIAIAMTGVFTTLTSFYINSYPNKKLIGYTCFEQLKDILPSLAISAMMLVGVLLIGKLALPTIAILIIQVVFGIVIYVALSVLFRLKPFYMMLQMLKSKKNEAAQE